MAHDLVTPAGSAGTRVAVNGIDMYYEEQGTGTPVLMLHGGVLDHRSWADQIPVLAEHFRVMTPDTRAHGRSTGTGRPLSYELFAADAVAFLGALGIEKAHVVGFGDGGSTGLLLAAEHPGLVDRLVCIGTPYHTSNYREGIIDLFAKIRPETLYRLVGPEFLEAVKKAETLYPDRGSWLAFWHDVVNGLWTRQPDMPLERLADVRVRTLVLHAENEQFYAKEHSEEMARTIPRARLEVVPDATHASPQERPSEVNAAIVRFLLEN
jgi:pimeloyl-ACP methyl ester carboxylesterase